MAFYIIPSLIQIKVTLAVDPDLLAFLKEVHADSAIAPKVKALAARLTVSNVDLKATLDAHPDPDTTD